MKRLDLNVTNKFLSILVSGQPGSGKTSFMGSAALDPRSAPVLHVDVSGNPESLLRLRKQPDVIRLGPLTDLDAVFDFFLQKQPANHALVTQFGCTPGYKTLILDGITAIQRKSFDDVMGYTPGKPGAGVPNPEWPHYNRSLAQMIEIATLAFQRLTGIHVLVSCLEKTEKRYMVPGEEKSSYPFHRPALKGQAQRELPGEAKCVIRLAHVTTITPDTLKSIESTYGVPKGTTPNWYSVGQFVHTKNAYAKDQHNFGIEYMPNPTVKKLLDLLESNAQARQQANQTQ